MFWSFFKATQFSRFAEALILSIYESNELHLKTQARYFQKAASEDKDVRSVFAMVEAVVTGSWDKLVEQCVLDNWREVLAALVTYTDSFSIQVGNRGVFGQQILSLIM